MDPATLTAFLAPFLPYLLSGVQTVAEEASRTFGREAWEAAKGLWAKLRPKVDDEPATAAAARELAKKTDDEQARTAFADQVEQLLGADPGLKAQLEQLWRETEGARTAFAAARGVAVAGDIKGSTVVSGDYVDIGP